MELNPKFDHALPQSLLHASYAGFGFCDTGGSGRKGTRNGLGPILWTLSNIFALLSMQACFQTLEAKSTVGTTMVAGNT